MIVSRYGIHGLFIDPEGECEFMPDYCLYCEIAAVCNDYDEWYVALMEEIDKQIKETENKEE